MSVSSLLLVSPHRPWRCEVCMLIIIDNRTTQRIWRNFPIRHHGVSGIVTAFYFGPSFCLSHGYEWVSDWLALEFITGGNLSLNCPDERPAITNTKVCSLSPTTPPPLHLLLWTGELQETLMLVGKRQIFSRNKWKFWCCSWLLKGEGGK